MLFPSQKMTVFRNNHVVRFSKSLTNVHICIIVLLLWLLLAKQPLWGIYRIFFFSMSHQFLSVKKHKIEEVGTDNSLF